MFKAILNWLIAHKDIIELCLNLIEVGFVGFVGIRLSSNSNKISDKQLKLEAAKARLHLRIYSKHLDCDNDDIRDSDILFIEYIDGIYDAFHAEDQCFIKVEFKDKSEMMIRVDGYYYLKSTSVDTSKILCEMGNKYNWSRVADLEHSIGKEDELIDHISLKKFVHITYANLLDDKVDEYYENTGNGNAFIKVDADKVEKYFNRENGNMKYKEIFIDKLTLEDLKKCIVSGYYSQPIRLKNNATES